MVQVSQRAGFDAPSLIRLLSRRTGIGARASTQATADRLSQSFSWTDAIALSTALNAGPAAASPGVRVSASAAEGECARVRAALAEAIGEDAAFAAGKRRVQRDVHARGREPVEAEEGFAPYRR